jgi:hypothetical protein
MMILRRMPLFGVLVLAAGIWAGVGARGAGRELPDSEMAGVWGGVINNATCVHTAGACNDLYANCYVVGKVPDHTCMGYWQEGNCHQQGGYCCGGTPSVNCEQTYTQCNSQNYQDYGCVRTSSGCTAGGIGENKACGGGTPLNCRPA